MSSTGRKTRSLKQYDISDYTINPGFMTDLEIKEMYRKLQFHMKIKYGMYHEEVIHRTIIRGLYKSDMYDPTKASKLVWFQSILYFYWIQERAPEYNHSDTDISLSTSLSKSNPDFTLIETIDNKEDDWKEFGEDEEPDYTEDVAKFITKLLDTGSYPLLKMRADGLTYREITDKTGLSTPTITGRLFAERNLMRDKVLSTAKGKEVISKRVSITRWVFGKKHKVVLSGQDRTCMICSKGFVFAGYNSGMRLFCSNECKTIHKVNVEKARVRPKKVKDPNKPDGRRNNGRPKKNKPKEDNGNI